MGVTLPLLEQGDLGGLTEQRRRRIQDVSGTRHRVSEANGAHAALPDTHVSLLDSERHHGIETGRPLSGDDASHHGNDREHQDDRPQQ